MNLDDCFGLISESQFNQSTNYIKIKLIKRTLLGQITRKMNSI